jgi:hypothetical protein
MKYFSLKIQLIFFSLIFIALRLDNINFLITSSSFIDSNYKYAIDHNFWEYSYFHHVSPFGKIFFDKLIFTISNLTNLKTSTIFYCFNVFSTYVFFWFILVYVNKTFENQLRMIFSLFVLITLFSIFFDNYENWRLGYHDHLTFFLISLFTLFTIFNEDLKKNKVYIILFFITLSYTLGFTFLLISISFIFIFKITNKIEIKKDLFFLALIFINFLFFSYKNFSNVNVFSPTTNGGANLIQRTIHAIGNENYYKLVKNSQKLPQWFKICNNYIFKNYQTLQAENNDNFQSKLAHGLCFLKNNNQINFLDYKKSLTDNKSNEKFLKLLEKDLANSQNKSWIYSGTHDDLSYYSTVAYTSYGSYIFITAIKSFPKEMLFGKIGKKGIFLTGLQMVSYGGLLPDYYENFSYPTRNYYLSYLFKSLILIIFMISAITPYVFFNKIKNLLFKKKLYFEDFIYLKFTSILLVQILLTSTATCCENPRIAVIYFPMILIVLILNLKFLIKDK